MMSQQPDKYRYIKLLYVFACVASFDAVLTYFSGKSERSWGMAVALVFWVLAAIGMLIFDWQAVRGALRDFFGKN